MIVMNALIDFMLKAELSIYFLPIFFIIAASQFDVKEGSKTDIIGTVVFGAIFVFASITVLVNGIYKGF